RLGHGDHDALPRLALAAGRAGHGRPCAAATVGARAVSTGNPALLTIDVECWFHAHNLGIDQASWGARDPRIDEPVDRLLPLFARRRGHAAFLLLGLAAGRH